jgi:hypothetical protein
MRRVGINSATLEALINSEFFSYCCPRCMKTQRQFFGGFATKLCVPVCRDCLRDLSRNDLERREGFASFSLAYHVHQHFGFIETHRGAFPSWHAVGLRSEASLARQVLRQLEAGNRVQ